MFLLIAFINLFVKLNDTASDSFILRIVQRTALSRNAIVVWGALVGGICLAVGSERSISVRIEPRLNDIP